MINSVENCIYIIIMIYLKSTNTKGPSYLPPYGEVVWLLSVSCGHRPYSAVRGDITQCWTDNLGFYQHIYYLSIYRIDNILGKVTDLVVSRLLRVPPPSLVVERIFLEINTKHNNIKYSLFIYFQIIISYYEG